MTTDAPRRSQLAQIAQVIGVFVAALWLVEILDVTVFDDAWERRGIRPRMLSGLQGVALAPLLHDDFTHLVANTVPLIILGGLVLAHGIRVWASVTGVVVVVGGLATWLFARSANHIGVSGVVFGYLGYLLAAAFFERSLRSIVIGAVAFFLYGGLLFGVLPGQPGVSWESHLFGAAAGVLAAWLLRSRSPARV